MIKAVIFDVGGVIVKDVLARTARELAEKHGMDFEKLNREIHSRWDDYKIAKINADEFWQNFVEMSGVPESADALKESVIEHLEEVPGTMDIIRSLKGKYKIAVLSNNTDEWSANEEKKFSFSKLFDAVVLSNKEGKAKPDKEFFDICLRRLGGLKPEECIFVDNHDYNIEAAKTIGFNTIQFENAEQLKKELNDFGVEI